MLHTSGIEWEFIPCFSVLLRIWFNQGAIWLSRCACGAGLRVGSGVVLAAARHVGLGHGRLAADVSVDCGGSVFVALRTAVPGDSGTVRGAYKTRFRSLLVTLALLSSLIELAMFGNLVKPSAVYLWTLWAAPAWLGWYLAVLIAERWSADWPKLRARAWMRPRGAAGPDQTVDVSADSSSAEAGSAAG